MAFNNVPVNGWPQIKQLEELDAIAKKVYGMPVFSSTDRDWLDEWESKLPELPEDPETDGVKVLTATTTSGTTVKSWEAKESGIADYSTTEQATGQKWIDGKDIFLRVWDFGENVSVVSGNYYTGFNIDTTNIDKVLLGTIINNDGTLYGGVDFDPTKENHTLLGVRPENNCNIRYLILMYTKIV